MRASVLEQCVLKVVQQYLLESLYFNYFRKYEFMQVYHPVIGNKFKKNKFAFLWSLRRSVSDVTL